jgi:enamine deaminase RidA (YjgF/YER057c/UK114 family)
MAASRVPTIPRETAQVKCANDVEGAKQMPRLRLLIAMLLLLLTTETRPGASIQSKDAHMTTLVTYFNPPELLSSPRYSHAAVIHGGRLVYVSGEQALDAKGELVGPGDFRRQAEQVFANVKRALAAAGADPSHVVKIDTHYVNRADLLTYREAREAFFAGRQTPPPTSTTVQVSGLVTEGALLEVGVTAVVPVSQ